MPKIDDLCEKAIFLLLKYVFRSPQSTLSYLHSYSTVLQFLEHVLVPASAVFSKEKKKGIPLFQLLPVYWLKHYSASQLPCVTAAWEAH